jgi:hypothetical protein
VDEIMLRPSAGGGDNVELDRGRLSHHVGTRSK